MCYDVGMDTRIVVRLNSKHKNHMAAVAQLCGLSLTSWVRATLVSAAENDPHSREALQLMAQRKLNEALR